MIGKSVVMVVGGCIVLVKYCESLDKAINYNSKASVSAGIITDKEIINGHTKSSGGML